MTAHPIGKNVVDAGSFNRACALTHEQERSSLPQQNPREGSSTDLRKPRQVDIAGRFAGPLQA